MYSLASVRDADLPLSVSYLLDGAREPAMGTSKHLWLLYILGWYYVGLLPTGFTAVWSKYPLPLPYYIGGLPFTEGI